ncbi:MAG: purine-binding chemotaxis protein CheW [Bacteroidales bacterium]|nr:purine-binding chemotaxis protein CheW [Bacteroidales bacterium]
MEIETKIKIDSYLTFKIGDEEFGAHVNKVLNILELQNITKVPKSPEYMKGIINLRGKVLPVIDTRIKFNMNPTEFTDDTCIVVMDLEIEDDVIHIGALVDSVVAVREIDENQINPPPSIGKSYKSEFITGIVKVNERFVQILDLVKLFTGTELSELKKSQNKVNEED